MIDDIIKLLNDEGKVIAIKTDTVYGLVCNAYDKNAVEKIYEIKKRDKKKPLSIFVKSADEVKKYVDESDITDRVSFIMKKFWPGALTIIFKKKNGYFDHLLNGNEGIGIRIPNDKELLAILEKIDFPLAQTSCNLSGEDPYNDVKTIKERIGDSVDYIEDGGTIEHNVASTVLSVLNGKEEILRVGDINIDDGIG